MPEACPTCDTLWRLYARASENLHELVGKHADARDKGDRNPIEILSHELVIAESALRAVRREIRRHESGRHAPQLGDQGKPGGTPQPGKPSK